MANLVQELNDTAIYYQKEAARFESMLMVIMNLPPWLQNMEGYARANHDDTDIIIDFVFYGGEEAHDTLVKNGCTGLVKQFSSSQGSHYYSGGEIQGIGFKNKVIITGAKTPADCKVVSIREMTTRYMEVCGPQPEPTDTTDKEDEGEE